MKVIFAVIFSAIFFQHVSFAYDIEGRIQLKDLNPQIAKLKIPDEQCGECGKEKDSPKLIVSKDGYVANAVIRLEGAFPISSQEPRNGFVLDQVNCEFEPHVMLIPKKSSLTVMNSEPFIHDVRAFDEQAKLLFNDAMPLKGQKLNKQFDRPGKYVVRCGIHKWMYAFVIVQEHPFYALSDENGFFKISGVPDGNYVLSVWHETLGEVKTEVGIKNKIINVVY